MINKNEVIFVNTFDSVPNALDWNSFKTQPKYELETHMTEGYI